MSRPRTPTAKLELRGAFKKHPERRRPQEPKDARPLGDPPERLPAKVRPFWDEIVEMVTGGILTYRDRWAVELAARLMAKAVSGSVSSSELSTLRSLLAAIGMTPADRSKLSVPVEKPKNPFTELAQEALRFRPI
jgi:hypothetical protein